MGEFPEYQEEIRMVGRAQESWRMGNTRKYKPRDDWEKVKVRIMFEGNLEKFKQNEDIQTKLLATTGKVLHSQAGFWQGWNARIIERVREELRIPQNQVKLK